MAGLQTIDPGTATGKAKELLDAVHKKLKITPNMTRVMANSPSVLEAYLGFSGALAGGTLDAKLREQLALVVAESNECNYCLSAHTAIGKMAGLSDTEVAGSREAQGSSAKTTAALVFAREVNDTRGGVSDESLDKVRQAGFSDAEIAEIIAHVALNVFTNYFNKAAAVDVDFPKVAFRKGA